MKRAQLQATIEVSCDVDTAKPSCAVCKVLRRKIMLAATAGVFAVGNDPKSVGYHVRVVEMPQISRDDMRLYFEPQIMDGALTLEDIPARLVTYGMMSPAQFAAEIDERIELARQDV